MTTVRYLLSADLFRLKFPFAFIPLPLTRPLMYSGRPCAIFSPVRATNRRDAHGAQRTIYFCPPASVTRQVGGACARRVMPGLNGDKCHVGRSVWK